MSQIFARVTLLTHIQLMNDSKKQPSRNRPSQSAETSTRTTGHHRYYATSSRAYRSLRYNNQFPTSMRHALPTVPSLTLNCSSAWKFNVAMAFQNPQDPSHSLKQALGPFNFWSISCVLASLWLWDFVRFSGSTWSWSRRRWIFWSPRGGRSRLRWLPRSLWSSPTGSSPTGAEMPTLIDNTSTVIRRILGLRWAFCSSENFGVAVFPWKWG